MKNFLLIFLALVAIAMIVLGIIADALPPIFTGIGFFIIIVFLHKYT